MSNTNIDIKRSSPAREPGSDVWRSFRNEMDRLFERFDRGIGLPSMRRVFDFAPFSLSAGSFDVNVPAVDLSEDDKAYKVTTELPGLDEKKIDVSLSGNRLILKGEKRREKEEKDKNHYISERSYGTFQRAFELPDNIDRDKVAAVFENGVLTVTLPKTAESQKQQKKIDVKAA